MNDVLKYNSKKEQFELNNKPVFTKYWIEQFFSNVLKERIRNILDNNFKDTLCYYYSENYKEFKEMAIGDIEQAIEEIFDMDDLLKYFK